MPTVNRLGRKPKQPRSNEYTDAKLLRRKFYNSTNWRKLRLSILQSGNCLCKECLKEGKVVPAEDIHHIRSPFNGGTINWELGLDPENLEPICKEHHAFQHLKERCGYKTNQEVIDELDALLSPEENAIKMLDIIFDDDDNL